MGTQGQESGSTGGTAVKIAVISAISVALTAVATIVAGQMNAAAVRYQADRQSQPVASPEVAAPTQETDPPTPRTVPTLGGVPTGGSVSGAAPRFPSAFDGSWRGVLREPGGASWTLRASIRAGTGKADVEYPGFCVGTWSVTAVNGTTVHVREKITKSVQFCDDPSTVVLTPQADGNLHLRYIPHVGTYQAEATLRPQE
ncbi:hypothetical protein [Micromonospora sp. SH-82]|uniref:hypothetical protein n=1 Tax=Micromonospora sp. SH-82 TaxID=3132938 RepID=UPI003EB7B397